ncbi:lipopolysaccharide assembly protein LapA domain-containing protein [Coralloluteibacterium thermophilus]
MVAILCVGIGVVFGALNSHTVALDFGLRQIEAAPVGLSLLVALLLGAIVGGLVLELGVIWPLRRRLRQQASATVADGQSPDAADLSAP